MFYSNRLLNAYSTLPRSTAHHLVIEKGGLDAVNTYTCLKMSSHSFSEDVLFQNWHNHSFYLIYGQHKKNA